MREKSGFAGELQKFPSSKNAPIAPINLKKL